MWQVDTKEEVWSLEAGDLEVRLSQQDPEGRVGVGGAQGPMPP